MKGLPILFAALGGAVVGAAVALLFAPQKGSDTRDAIKDFLRTHCPTIKEKDLTTLADQIAGEIEEMK